MQSPIIYKECKGVLRPKVRAPQPSLFCVAGWSQKSWFCDQSSGFGVRSPRSEMWHRKAYPPFPPVKLDLILTTSWGACETELGERLVSPSSAAPVLELFLSHPQVMDFYCQSCETAMCRECTEGEHAEHPTVPLKDVVEQHKASLQVQLDAVNKRYGRLPQAPNWPLGSGLASGSPVSGGW